MAFYNKCYPPAHLLLKGESVLVPFGIPGTDGNDPYDRVNGWITTFGRLYVQQGSNPAVFMGNPIVNLDPDHGDIITTFACSILDKYRGDIRGTSLDGEFESILDLIARLKPKLGCGQDRQPRVGHAFISSK